MTFTLRSNAFQDGAAIPSVYTCDGKNISPPLAWQGAPAKTASYVLILDDPDAPAGDWVHWIVYNIAGNANDLPENMSSPPSGANFGKNSWGNAAYGGPCPPDREHRYFFRLYALDAPLNLNSPTLAQIQSAMQGHVLGSAQLMGRYRRK